MKAQYFVMLSHPAKPAAILIDPDTNEVGFYDSESDAGEAAESSTWGEEHGYEIFQLGQGCS